MRRPSPRGPASLALLALLSKPPPDPSDVSAAKHLAEAIAKALDATVDLLRDDDLQSTLYCRYALHLHGLPGVDDGWEWHPALVAAIASLQTAFEDALRDHTAGLVADTAPTPDRSPSGTSDGPNGVDPAADLLGWLNALTRADLGGSLSRHLARRATPEQFADFLRFRSVYQLKEADPHTLAIPRLRGRAKSALVEIQADEYGDGLPTRMHSTLFADTLRAVGLDDTLGSHVDDVPAIVLAADNAAVLFGLHRRLRGAAVGHLAALEMTSSVPMRRYSRAAARLGLDAAARAYFDEHIEVDAVHEQVALHDMVAPLVSAEPELRGDVLLGAATCLLLDAAITDELLARWGAVTTSRPAPALRAAFA